jgi:Domain of unknown function (DUF4330)
MASGECKLFGRFNAFDLACSLVLALCALGFTLAKAGHAGVNQAIQGTKKIDIDLYFTGVKTKDLDLFKIGDPASLTIRNVPVQPPMTITAVRHQPKQVAFLSPDGKQALAFADPASPMSNDFEVTVADTADVTADGYVVRGNKLKVGNTIELEGFKYRIQGVVCNINPSAKQ